MQRPTIPDKDIPTSDPETLVYCFTPWVQKIVNNYVPILDRFAAVDMDDLFQSGIIGLLKAAEKYDPDGGACFMNYSRLHITSAIRRCLGLDGKELPPVMVPLDKLITDDADESILDTIPDPNILPFDEPIIERETRTETADAVHAAVDRLRNSKQREVIRRVWFDGQDKQSVADDMGINLRALRSIDLEARHKLRRDHLLKQYAIPFFSASLGRFRRTFTSVVEAAVIWRDEHIYGNGDSDELPPARTWTPAQQLAQMRRKIEARKE